MIKPVISLIALFLLLNVFSTSSAMVIPLEQTISLRQSVRSYTGESISNQQLLEILWVAYGHVNNHKTVPQIGYDYALIIFPVNETGSYQCVPENNTIVTYDLSVNKETLRPHNQNWPSDASVVLVIVWNQTRMSNPYFASAEAGCIVQNVHLGAVSLNLGTCCVGAVDSEGLRNALKLPSTLIPLLVMPLGHPAHPYPNASPNYGLMTGNLPPVQYSTFSFQDALENMLYTTKWSTENLTSQELSQLLWAAYGYTNVTHKTTYHRTTPSAFGIYPLIVFVSNATGIYQYIPENHSVIEIAQNDRRFEIASACAGQTWAANAPTIFLIVYNSSYNNGNTGDGGTLPHMFMQVNAGTVIQQLLLEASAWNLTANIITQGLEDWNGTTAEQLRNILGLPPSHIPLYVAPVGTQALDKTPPTIGTPSQNPEPTAVEPHQNVTITVNIKDETTGIHEVILSYSTDEGKTWTNTTMGNISDNTYVAIIPGFEAGTHVQYKIIAYDKVNNPSVDDRKGEYYVYTVIPEFTITTLMLILLLATTLTLITKKLQKTRETPKNHQLQPKTRPPQP